MLPRSKYYGIVVRGPYLKLGDARYNLGHENGNEDPMWSRVSVVEDV